MGDPARVVVKTMVFHPILANESLANLGREGEVEVPLVVHMAQLALADEEAHGAAAGGVHVDVGEASGMIDNIPAKGNGSLSFNETEENLAKYGNYAFKIYPQAGAKLWESYDVKGFQGLKSYHFFKDKVVALGSDLQADTDRKMQTVLFQEMTDTVPWVSQKNPARWNPDEPTLVHNDRAFRRQALMRTSMKGGNYIISPYGHAYLIPGNQEGELAIEWEKRKFHIVAYGNSGSKTGSGALVRLLQDSSKPSSHHYCLLLNSDGKSPDELNDFAKQTLKTPGYKVLRQDKAAHAIRFSGTDGEGDLDSVLIWEPDTPLGLTYVTSANRPMNLMMQKNEEGNLVVSICDPTLDYDAHQGITHEDGHGYNKLDPRNIRTLKVTFTSDIEILEARSGLPESNPDLEATVEDGKTLTFKTRDGISDTFVIKLK